MPKPRILLVSPYSIHPMIHGGAVRIGQLLRRLSRDFDLYLLIFVGGSDDPEQRRALEPWCRRVFFQQLPVEDSVARRGDLPPAARKLASPRIAERLRHLVIAHRIDLAILEYAELGQYVEDVRAGGARVVLVEHDVSFRSRRRRRRLGFDHRYSEPGREPRSWRRDELRACRRAHQVHVMSDEDRRYLAECLGAAASRLRVIPNGVDTGYYQPSEEPTGSGVNATGDLLFVGSFPHLPNLDALDFFLQRVWPRIRSRRPETGLTVAGARPPERVLALDGVDGVTVAGEVPDLRPLYQGHRALVAPVRAGSGTRLKILEAMASGLPVLSTALGAEGLEVRPERDLLVADTVEELADGALRLLGDESLCRRLAANGRSLAVEHYDWDAIYDGLKGHLTDLVPDVSTTAGTVERSTPQSPQPEISVVLLATPAEEVADLTECLRRQHTERTVEVLWSVAGPAGSLERRVADASAVRLVSAGVGSAALDLGPVGDLGRALDRAAAAARGGVIAVLGRGARPADPDWLDKLTDPFFLEHAPAAVQGGIHERFFPTSPRHQLGFTRESERWRERYGGVAFQVLNAAFLRGVWERFPLRSRVRCLRTAAGSVRSPRPGFSSCLAGRRWFFSIVRFRCESFGRGVSRKGGLGDRWGRAMVSETCGLIARTPRRSSSPIHPSTSSVDWWPPGPSVTFRGCVPWHSSWGIACQGEAHLSPESLQ